MKGLKWFILGSVFFFGCATAGVPFFYRFYHLTGNDFSGTLLGANEKDDEPFTSCKPVNGKQRCVVVFYTELNKLVADYKTTKTALIDCQKGKR